MTQTYASTQAALRRLADALEMLDGAPVQFLHALGAEPDLTKAARASCDHVFRLQSYRDAQRRLYDVLTTTESEVL